MSVYRVFITSSKTGELIEVDEFIREFFTSKMMKVILTGMFYFSCNGCDFNHLRAQVRRDGEIIFDLMPETIVDGSRIFTDFYLQRGLERPQHIRHMIVGE